MGLSRPDWLALTPKQYTIFRDAWYRKSSVKEHETWEVARWQVFRTLCPPKKQQISIMDLIEFPWEKEEKKEQERERKKGRANSKERFDNLKERWK